MKAVMKTNLSKRNQDVTAKVFLHMASPLDSKLKSVPFLCPEYKEVSHTNLEMEAMQTEEKKGKCKHFRLKTNRRVYTTPFHFRGNDIPTASVQSCKGEVPSPSSSTVAKRNKHTRETTFSSDLEEAKMDSGQSLSHS